LIWTAPVYAALIASLCYIKVGTVPQRYYLHPLFKLMEETSTFAKYYTAEDAQFLVDLLQRNGSPYEMSHEVNQLDNIYIGDSIDQLYLLKIPPGQFMTVNRLLTEQAKLDFNTESFTHYFDSFDNDELVEVLNEPNDWNAYDVEVARLFWGKKNLGSSQDITALEYSTSYSPERLKTEWIVLGYLISFSAMGIFAGLAITTGKKTLQNGTKVFLYDEASRRHGGIMIILGAAGSFLLFTRLLLP